MRKNMNDVMYGHGLDLCSLVTLVVTSGAELSGTGACQLLLQQCPSPRLTVMSTAGH